jgi:hypothetical protein
LSCYPRQPDAISPFKQQKKSSESQEDEKIRTERRELLRELSKSKEEINEAKIKQLEAEVFRDSTSKVCRDVISAKDRYDEQKQAIEASKKLQKCSVCQKFVNMVRMEASSESNQESDRKKYRESLEKQIKKSKDPEATKELRMILSKLMKNQHVSDRPKGSVDASSPSVRAVCHEDEYDKEPWDVILASGCGESPWDVDGLRDVSGLRDPAGQALLFAETGETTSATLSPIQIALALSSGPGGGGALGLPAAVDSLIRGMKTKEMTSSNLPLQCGGQSIPKGKIESIHKYTQCLADKTRGGTAVKISQSQCEEALVSADAELDRRTIAITSALGISYDRAKMTIHDRLKLYMLARTQTYTGEFVESTIPQPNSLDPFSYKVVSNSFIA